MRAFVLVLLLVVMGDAACQQADPVLVEFRALIQQKKWAEVTQLATSLERKTPPTRIVVDKGLAVSSQLLAEVVLATLDPERSGNRQQRQDLGDKAFSNGDYFLAARYWNWQESLTNAGALWLVFPGKEPVPLEPALWFRRLLLRSFLEFPSAPAPEEIREFLDKHGDARAIFLGKAGSYRELMVELEGVHGLAAIAAPTHPRGGADRNPGSSQGPTPYELSSWCSSGPWVKTRLGAEKPPQSPSVALRDAHHSIHPAPVLLGSNLYFQDETSLSVQDLKSGKVSLLWGDPSGRAASLATGEPSLVLLAPNLLLAILRIKPQDASAGAMADSRLVCVEAGADGGRLIFSLSPPGEFASWEAGPVILGNRAFALVRFRVGGRDNLRVLCYNLAARAPDLLWSTDLPQDSNPDPRAYLPPQMAAADNQLFISTSNRLHSLNVEQGGILWTRSNPVDKLKHPGSSRNRLLPGYGKVFHSASRAGWVECLDAWTGCSLWRRDMSEDISLLGLCSGNLILEPSRGLIAINVQTGNDASGWITPDDFGNIHSIGRGFFAGRYYFWPTNQGHLVVHCPTGRPGADPTLFRKLGPGSLSLTPGGLLLSNDSHIALYPNPGQWFLKSPPPVAEVKPVSSLR